MDQSLSDMTLEELWQLFPIILKEHNPEYKIWFSEEKEAIIKCLKGIEAARISHIGSSAVPGLIAKPIVDILLEVDNDSDKAELVNRLQADGWLLMSGEDHPEMKLSFNKGYTPNGFAPKVYHLHVRHYADWDELYFRDYLLDHKDAANEYGKLKQSLLGRYEHDRDGYTKAKTGFVQKHTELARKEYDGRYLPNSRRV